MEGMEDGRGERCIRWVMVPSESRGLAAELRARGMECEEYCTAVFLQSEDGDFLRLTLLEYNSLNLTA